VTLLLGICLCIPLSAPGFFWTAIGPEGGKFIGSVTDPADANHIVAIEENLCEAFETTDGGASWTSVGNVAGASDLYDFAAFDTHRLYGIAGYYCHRSRDGGHSWQSSRFQSDAGSVRVVAAHPSDSNIVYVAGSYYKSGSGRYALAFSSSSDGGETWATTQHLDFEVFHPYDLAVSRSDPSRLFICGYRRKSGWSYGAMVRSLDGGASWSDISKSVVATSYRFLYTVAVDPTDASRVYAGGDGYFYRSMDGGDTWSCISQSVDVVSLGIDPSAPARVYAGGNGTLSYSSDHARTWTARQDAIGGRSYHIEVAPADTSRVIVSAGTGLYGSTDGGTNWTSIHSGIQNAPIAPIAIAPSLSSRAYIDYEDTGIFASNDSGSHWEKKAHFDGSGNIGDIAIHPATPDVLLAIEGPAGNSSELFRSTNAGGAWTQVDSYFSEAYCLCWHPTRHNVVFAGGEHGGRDGLFSITRSTDGGQTWTERYDLPTADHYNSACRDIAVSPSDPDEIFAVGCDGNGGKIFRSANGGTAWSDATGNLATYHGTYWTMYALTPGPGGHMHAGTSAGVFYTTDGGTNWLPRAGFTRNTRTLAYDAGRAMLFAGTSDRGVYDYAEAEGTWKEINVGLGDLGCNALALDAPNGYLLLATRTGVWRYDMSPSHALDIVSVHGSPTPPVGNHRHTVGTVLTNSVNSPVQAGTIQYVCTGWTLTGNHPASGAEATVTMTHTNDAVLTWHWGTNYWLQTQTSGWGTVQPESGWHARDSSVWVTATAAPYHQFVRWAGASDRPYSPVWLTITHPSSITATFAADVAVHDTPHWWLALHGHTNLDWDAEALTDRDGDGMAAWQEHVADTCPTNRRDYFRITSCDAETGARPFVLWWNGAAERTYTVYASPQPSGTWSNVYEGAGSPAPMSYTSPPSPGQSFKLGVELAE